LHGYGMPYQTQLGEISGLAEVPDPKLSGRPSDV